MTVRDCLNALNAVPEDKRNLPVVAIHGASGAAYEVGLYGIETVKGDETSGILCDMDEGQEYFWGSLN